MITASYHWSTARTFHVHLRDYKGRHVRSAFVVSIAVLRITGAGHEHDPLSYEGLLAYHFLTRVSSRGRQVGRKKSGLIVRPQKTGHVTITIPDLPYANGALVSIEPLRAR